MIDSSTPGPPRPDARLAEHLTRPPRCLRLADLPTPVERAPWLDTDHAEVWIKRDDLSSDLYGGGKVRKLEWSLANPPFAGSGAITSVGGIGSNHLVALAIFLHRLDRHLHALVFDQPWTGHVRDNLATMASLGASFWYVRRRWQLPAAFAAFYVRRGEKLGQAMTAGGSTPLGCFGFVEAGFELAQQIAAGDVPSPHAIFITGGTGGASAGLALGLALAGVSTKLAIVSAVEPLLYNRVLMAKKLGSIHAALRRHGLSGPRRAATRLSQAGVSWSIDHRFVGAGYGAPIAEGRAVAELAAEHGVGFDLTYTSKCAAALRASTIKGPILLWHTHAHNDLSRFIAPDWADRLPPRLRASLPALALAE